MRAARMVRKRHGRHVLGGDRPKMSTQQPQPPPPPHHQGPVVIVCKKKEHPMKHGHMVVIVKGLCGAPKGLSGWSLHAAVHTDTHATWKDGQNSAARACV